MAQLTPSTTRERARETGRAPSDVLVRLTYRPDVRLDIGEHGEAQVSWGRWNLTTGKCTAGLVAALARLHEGATEDELAESVRERDGAAELAQLWTTLGRLRSGGAVQTTIVHGEPLATLVPSGAGAPVPRAVTDNDRCLRLSRFAYLRAVDGGFTLSSPLGRARVDLHTHGAVAVAQALAQSRRLPEIEPELLGVYPEAVRRLIGLFDAAGALGEADDRVEVQQWAFHDLLFHSRSRLGRNDRPYGATYPGRKSRPAPPAEPPQVGEPLDLPVPQASVELGMSLPFSAVLESRRSVRRHGDEPITLEQLATLLYFTARTQGEPYTDTSAGFESITRPYPGSGGAHSLEIYPVIGRCAGLRPGLYRYDTSGHRLLRHDADPKELDVLLADARGATGMHDDPQVLFVISARFDRMMWKYSEIAYSGILKDAGCLLQTLYLVATAIGLAPCAIGGGDADRFAHVADKDYYAETSVAEFIVGSRPEGDQS